MHTVTHDQVKLYYGETLSSSDDLKTNACRCANGGLSPSAERALSEINEEVLARFYGCGSPLPPLLEDRRVLDLGCGSGRDAYLAAKLAGPDGYVVGVDMTEKQLEVAARNLPSQMRRFGYEKPNVKFLHGYIENLASLGLADNSFDVVISNCVLNLSPYHEAVFSEIFRVLKPGGELYFSDVFADRRVPTELRADPILVGECLAGAMYREDFRRILRRVGRLDYRTISTTRIDITSESILAKVGQMDFYSVTVRAFKLDCLEDKCEDYGQVAIYRGGIPDWPYHFDLDDHHRFYIDEPKFVCGNTAAMLQQSRYGGYFHIDGDRAQHLGPFMCGQQGPDESCSPGAGASCC